MTVVSLTDSKPAAADLWPLHWKMSMHVHLRGESNTARVFCDDLFTETGFIPALGCQLNPKTCYLRWDTQDRRGMCGWFVHTQLQIALIWLLLWRLAWRVNRETWRLYYYTYCTLQSTFDIPHCTTADGKKKKIYFKLSAAFQLFELIASLLTYFRNPVLEHFRISSLYSKLLCDLGQRWYWVIVPFALEHLSTEQNSY